jgi:uncharacterized membrane protein YebE (DUF533 family)
MSQNQPSQSAQRLRELIEKAIDDGRVTNKEYDEILALADADGIIDQEERSLLSQLQDMLADKSVVRTPE